MTTTTPTGNSTTTLKRALVAIDQLQEELKEARRELSEPIAIVGLGCRFPGGVVDAESYWRLLEEGVDAIQEVPTDRFDVDSYYAPGEGTPGKLNTRWGGFLDHIDEFDAAFFGISPREAEAMDPSQRLVLEVGWEAIETAGYGSLAGSRTGVFVGIIGNDYGMQQFSHPEDLTPYVVTGSAHSIASGRLAYLLDLRGPAVSVDTACSSSLVSVHMACQSLRSGDCDLALAGGVNVILSPMTTIAFSQFGMMSPDGRCHAFDADANGFVRGEGCGMVVLKRMSDAEADGDEVLAVIRGSAVNQDGRSTGLTAPNVLSQADLLRRAHTASGVRPEQISYIEAHGTGTALGDPIEVDALAEVLPSEPGAEWHLGAVKSNVGHLEAAAGVAGLIKVVLSLRHGVIPPNLHYRQLNPHVGLDEPPFVVPTEPTEWVPRDGRRIAGVSSFGLSGTNAHLVVEEAETLQSVEEDRRRPRSVLALSARSAEGLKALVERHRARVRAEPSGRLTDYCYSVNTGRGQFAHRFAVNANSMEELDLQLRVAEGGHAPATAGGTNEPVLLYGGDPRIDSDLREHLIEGAPVFKDAIDWCEDLFSAELGASFTFSATQEKLSADSTLALATHFSMQYGLTQLWASWGVEPAAVLGYGAGEFAAACAAKAVSLEDAVRLVVGYGRWLQQQDAVAALIVHAKADEIAHLLGEGTTTCHISAIDGPRQVVVVGHRKAIHEFRGTLREHELTHQFLADAPNQYLSARSADDEPIRRLCGSLALATPQVPYASTLTGQLWPWERALDADYWCRKMHEPARFADAVEALRQGGYRRFLELGPGNSLTGLISPTDPPDLVKMAALPPGDEPWSGLLDALGRLYESGVDVDWAGFDQPYSRSRISVPLSPFVRSRHWFTPTTTESPTMTKTRTVSDESPSQLSPRQDESETDERLTRRDLLAVEPFERFSLVSHHLSDGVQQALSATHGSRRRSSRTTVAATVGLDDKFISLGMDSLMALGVRNRIRSQFEVDVPVSSFLRDGTVRRITELIVNSVADPVDGSDAELDSSFEGDAETPAADLLLEALSSLPEEQAEALLQERPA